MQNNAMREVVAASYGRTELANRKRLAVRTVLPYSIDHLGAFARAKHVLDAYRETLMKIGHDRPPRE
jgi:hypothetical protein